MIVLLSAAGVSGAFAQDEADTVDRSWRKDVPEITWKNISPPFKDYRYYNHVEVFPFEFNSKTFSPVNAWWLSEAATLVYADEDFVRSRFKKAGLKNVVFSDIVTKVPPAGFYRHVGEIRFIDGHGSVHDRIPESEKENIEIKHEPRDNYISDDQFRGGLQGLVPDAFRDHVPLIYTVHLWNNLIE